MFLHADTLSLKRGRNWNRCAHCGKVLRTHDRIFFQSKDADLWCSVKCAEADLRLRSKQGC